MTYCKQLKANENAGLLNTKSNGKEYSKKYNLPNYLFTEVVSPFGFKQVHEMYHVPKKNHIHKLDILYFLLGFIWT